MVFQTPPGNGLRHPGAGSISESGRLARTVIKGVSFMNMISLLSPLTSGRSASVPDRTQAVGGEDVAEISVRR